MPPSPTLRLRVRVLTQRRRLDREIAGGAPVEASAARRLREQQLTTPAKRLAIGASLEHILAAAEECQLDPGSRLILQFDAVLESRDQLLELIAVLRSAAPMTPRTVALALLLADSPDSPVVSARAANTIRQSLAELTRLTVSGGRGRCENAPGRPGH